MPGKMTETAIAAALVSLRGWMADGDRALTKTFRFPDHIAAMGFVTQVAMVAEAMDHHPDLRIVYNTVEIRLYSHDADGVTSRDIRLAQRIDART